VAGFASLADGVGVLGSSAQAPRPAPTPATMATATIAAPRPAPAQPRIIRIGDSPFVFTRFRIRAADTTRDVHCHLPTGELRECAVGRPAPRRPFATEGVAL